MSSSSFGHSYVNVNDLTLSLSNPVKEYVITKIITGNFQRDLRSIIDFIERM